MFYFDAVDNQEKLIIELKEWLKTPYKHRCCVKGKGVDCINLIIGVFQNIGAIRKRIQLPEYEKDWQFHNDSELMYETIKKTVDVQDIYNIYTEKRLINKIMNGDILLYKFGKVSSHAGIFFNNRVYQSLTKMEVIHSAFDDGLWRSRLTNILRLKK